MANGNVVPCCEDLLGEKVMGNVLETNLQRIWHGDTYVEFRRRFREKDYHYLCRKCYITQRSYLVHKTG